MERKIISYNFFRVGNHWEYVKDRKLYILSDEIMECMKNQYKMQGFMIMFDNTSFLSVARVENDLECFLQELREGGKNNG